MNNRLSAAVEYHVVNTLGWRDLRPLQRASVGPVRSGADCLLIAPTAGGKTEAAFFPLLSQMEDDQWRGTSVLYVAPLRALLNNLYPRIESYAAWLGRTVGLWHGDVGDGDRRRILSERPDIVLTTPESLEAMLVSRRVDHRRFFADVRAVVVESSVLWTWAGLRANATVIAALGADDAVAENAYIEFPGGLRVADLRAAVVDGALPFVSKEAVDGLKFSAALPQGLAVATLAERLVDGAGALDVVRHKLVVR